MLAAALLLALVTATDSPIPDAFRPTHVEIESSRHLNAADAGNRDSTDTVCDKVGASWRCTGGWIEDSWVQQLLYAARIPDQPRDVHLLGYSDADVDRISHDLQRQIRTDSQWTFAERRAAIGLAVNSGVRSMLDGSVTGLVARGSQVVSVSVALRDARNREALISSTSVRERMLPWDVSFEGQRAVFPHAAISTAIARMLPPGDANRSLLVTSNNQFELLMDTIESRIIGCRYDENPSDRAFCARMRIKKSPVTPMQLPPKPRRSHEATARHSIRRY